MTPQPATEPPEPTGEAHPPDEAERYERVAPFVERLAADFAEAGMQRMAARVFACLLVAEEAALTSAELTARLQASPAAISGAVRYLSQVRLVRRERAPGSRRERYRLPEDVWYQAVAQRDGLLDRWVATLRTGAQALDPQTAPARRIKEGVEFLTFLRHELNDLLERWHREHPRHEGA